MSDRRTIIEVPEDDYWDIIRLDSEAPCPPNIEYRIRNLSGPRFITPGDTQFGNGSQIDDEGEQAA